MIPDIRAAVFAAAAVGAAKKNVGSAYNKFKGGIHLVITQRGGGEGF